jgi:hypothetical protein
LECDTHITSKRQSPILIHGIDTVKVNVKLLEPDGKPSKQQEVRYDLVALFEMWQEHAKANSKPVATSMTFHEARMMMYPNGAPSWKYVMRNDCLELKVCPRLKVPMIAKVTLQSAYLWKVGNVQETIAEVQDFLIGVFDASLMLQAAQIDLCVDMIGLELPTEWEQIFISHALTKKPIGETHKDQAYYKGRKLETIIFSGHGNPVNGKLYNKTKEIQQHSPDKVWFHDLWRTKGWNGKAKVWRMEFSVEREGLHEMDLEDIHETIRNLKRLWAYCSYEWLRMVIPEPDLNRTRWTTHPLWLHVQHAFDQDSDPALDALGPLVRDRKRQKNIEQLTAQIAGCATTLAAWCEDDELDERADAPEIFSVIYDKVQARWNKLNVFPQDVVKEKKFIYSQKG